jgi:hypothetical protein
MRTLLPLIFFACVVASASCNFMEHAHCDDTVVKRVPSPDGKLDIVISNRSCSGGSGLYSSAKVEEVGGWLWRSTLEHCFLVTLAGGYHHLDATWLDQKHIEVTSSDELDGNSISSEQETCNDISVSYSFKAK